MSGDPAWSKKAIEEGEQILAGVYAQLGRFEEATTHLDKFNQERAKKGRPPHTLTTFDEWYFVPSVRKRYVESLRMAGMPPK